MLPVVTAQEMRKLDQKTIESYGIAGIVLMERAGETVARWIQQKGVEEGWENPTALVVCGKGNNGGDGFVIARHLHEADYQVDIILFGNKADVKGDARVNLEIAEKLGIPIYTAEDIQSQKVELQPTYSVVVDALLGTGFRGELRGMMKEAVEFVKQFDETSLIVAVDIPSGQSSDVTQPNPEGIFADATITMGALKRAHVVKPASEAMGEVQVAVIGIPREELEQSAVWLVEPNDVLLPPIDPMRNKYTAGKVGVIAGSAGFTGAAALAAEGALRMGAGLVRLAIPDSLNPILEQKLTEVITVPVPGTDQQTIGAASMAALTELVEWSDVLVIGPGLGRTPDVQQTILFLLENTTIPVVIDADALFALSENLDFFKQHAKSTWLLTPHDGEFRRFLPGVSREDILNNRIQLVQEFVQTYPVHLVLKSATTVSATPEGDVFINSSGNAGLASGGTGDVLSGFVGGYWAQIIHNAFLEPEDVLISVPFIHGFVADFLAERKSMHTITATDLLHHLGDALQTLEEGIYNGTIRSPYRKMFPPGYRT